MLAVAVGADAPLNLVPQFPVQPPVTVPPPVGDASTFSVHCLCVKFAVKVRSTVGVILGELDAAQPACPDAPNVGLQPLKQ